MVPGKSPLEALTLALSPLFPERTLKSIREDLEDNSARGLHLLLAAHVKQSGARVRLVVDQFEELFTQTAIDAERQQFLDILLAAISEPHGPSLGLLTLRADFYDRRFQYPELGRLIKNHQIMVFPMEMADLREVIEKPAQLPDVQLTFEEGLVGDLLFDVRGQVGALPLLQFTLRSALPVLRAATSDATCLSADRRSQRCAGSACRVNLPVSAYRDPSAARTRPLLAPVRSRYSGRRGDQAQDSSALNWSLSIKRKRPGSPK